MTEREQRMAAVSATLGQAVPNLFPGDAHAFLMGVYKHPDAPMDVRISAAAAALRFEKPTFSAVAIKTDDPTFAAELDAAYKRVGLTIDGTIDGAHENGSRAIPPNKPRNSANSPSGPDTDEKLRTTSGSAECQKRLLEERREAECRGGVARLLEIDRQLSATED